MVEQGLDCSLFVLRKSEVRVYHFAVNDNYSFEGEELTYMFADDDNFFYNNAFTAQTFGVQLKLLASTKKNLLHLPVV